MTDLEQAILESWRDNADAWVNAVRNGEIASREAVTNRAIVDAITALTPETVLDIGCGEGWLGRALHAHGIRVVGIDAEPALINAARDEHGDYHVMTYQQLEQWRPTQRFDLLVCNFSLLGHKSVESVFRAAPALLNDGGHLIVQTLHPDNADVRHPEWRQGSWAGFSPTFRNPAPWYCRTREDWLSLYRQQGFTNPQQVSPLLPDTDTPASLILCGQYCNAGT